MRVVPYTYENTVCACHAVHKQNTLFNNELKTEMTTIIPLANRARSHIALTRRTPDMAIYMWKILERKVPNFSPPIQCHISDRRGRLCSSGVVPTGHLGMLCHNSFRNIAATLFNCLPKHIRNIVNCANPIMFKRALDNHLCSIEDSPMVPNECNSLNSRSKEKTMTDRWRAAIADQAE